MKSIIAFQGEYRFLSNFWPCYILYDNKEYATVEHAYQAAKFTSSEVKNAISDCATPGEAKDWPALNHQKTDLGWTIEKKLLVMEELLLLKFGGKDPLLTRALLSTGDAEIIEGNTWNDRFWGVCENVGENHLGRLLMKTREKLNIQKKQILLELQNHTQNNAVAKKLSITPRSLYEKMIAFSISNEEYWIS